MADSEKETKEIRKEGIKKIKDEMKDRPQFLIKRQAALDDAIALFESLEKSVKTLKDMNASSWKDWEGQLKVHTKERTRIKDKKVDTDNESEVFFDLTKLVEAVQKSVEEIKAELQKQQIQITEQMHKVGEQATEFEKKFEALGIDKQVKNCLATQQLCKEARDALEKEAFQTAVSLSNDAQNMIRKCETEFGNLFKHDPNNSDLLAVLRTPLLQAQGLCTTAQKHNIEWLLAKATEVEKSIKSALDQSFGLKPHEAIPVAKAALEELVQLNKEWAEYRKPAEDWDKEEPMRKRNIKLAKMLVQECGDQEKLKPFAVGAQTYLDAEVQANASAQEGLAGKIKAADGFRTPNSKFLVLEKRYRTEVKWPALSNELEAEIQQNPNGSAAKMKKALNKSEFEQRMTKVATLIKLAENIEFKEELSVAEMAAIHSYTIDADCRAMNAALLSGSEDEKVKAMVEVTSAAMNKLLPHPDTTYRGETAWPGADAQYIQGNDFAIKAFWSTSVGNSFSGVYQITIVPKKDGQGKVVSTFSEFPREVEVLFPPQTRFKVTKRTGDVSTGSVEVEVQEL